MCRRYYNKRQKQQIAERVRAGKVFEEPYPENYVSVLCCPRVQVVFCRHDFWMADVAVSGGLLAGARRRRSAVEWRRIVEETLEAGASVARVALKYGVNANQVFQWRRLHRDGMLGAEPEQALKLLPVSVMEETELRKPELQTPEPSQVEPSRCGALHIELPGKVRITLNGSVDPVVVHAVLKSLRS